MTRVDNYAPPELDNVLATMLDAQPEVSDLLFTVDKPLQVESFGELKPVTSIRRSKN